MYSFKIITSCFSLLLVFRQKLRVNSENQRTENFLVLRDYNRIINEREERNDEN